MLTKSCQNCLKNKSVAVQNFGTYNVKISQKILKWRLKQKIQWRCRHVMQKDITVCI